MQRPTTRLAARLALSGTILLALLTPAAALAADPAGGASGSGGASVSSESSTQPTDASPSPSGSDQVISVDPTFITATATPKGAVLSSTGRPQHTLPPTDAIAGSSPAGATAQGLPLLLLALATICLVAARLPEVRHR